MTKNRKNNQKSIHFPPLFENNSIINFNKSIFRIRYCRYLNFQIFWIFIPVFHPKRFSLQRKSAQSNQIQSILFIICFQNSWIGLLIIHFWETSFLFILSYLFQLVVFSKLIQMNCYISPPVFNMFFEKQSVLMRMPEMEH